MEEDLNVLKMEDDLKIFEMEDGLNFVLGNTDFWLCAWTMPINKVTHPNIKIYYLHF